MLGACAGSLADAPHGRAAGEWSVRMPATRSPIGSLALGRGGTSAPAAASTAPLTTRAHVQRWTPVARPALAKVDAPREAPALPLMAANPETSLSATLPATQESEAQLRYASREQTSPQQQEFRGGQILIVGLGAVLVVVLVLVLLIVLI
jgi:hypothetical protein